MHEMPVVRKPLSKLISNYTLRTRLATTRDQQERGKAHHGQTARLGNRRRGALLSLEQNPELDEILEVDATVKVIVTFREKLAGVEVIREDQKVIRVDRAIIVEIAG